MGVVQQFHRKRIVRQKIGANSPLTKRTVKPGEKLGANLPLFWNNDGKDRSKGQICPLAKEDVFEIMGLILQLCISIWYESGIVLVTANANFSRNSPRTFQILLCQLLLSIPRKWGHLVSGDFQKKKKIILTQPLAL
jgi:hypothetical protein